MARKQEATITPEMVETVLRLQPEFANNILDTIDAQIEELESTRSTFEAFSQGQQRTATKRKKGSKRVPRGKHGEMAIRILAKAGATNKKSGILSSQFKESKDHDFGSALNATLDGLAKKDIVKYENVSEGDKPRYTWWLNMSEEKALVTAAEAAKAGRKPSKKNGKAAA